jgi:methylase of polypeptide subunit release factors
MIAAIGLALGARDVSGWSLAEEELSRDVPSVSPSVVQRIRQSIARGDDPLGDLFCSIRPPAERRKQGATFTPLAIVHSMLDWAESYGLPERVVDPGTGSGRFAVQAGLRFREARILGIESDPLPALIARANLAASGLAARSEVIVGDYRSVPLLPVEGKTLYIGNPPYTRHHRLDSKWKEWLVREAGQQGLAASQLAGLHVHFFLATVLKASPGDFGAFITAAEWLDVNYGSLVRDLFLGPLGGQQIIIIGPTALPFPDAATTAAITMFDVRSRPKSVCLSRVERLADIGKADASRAVRRERLEAEGRWTPLTRAVKKARSGYVELGELCRVHRGQVTGANKVWIAGPHSEGLPESVLFPAITKGRELFHVGRVLSDASFLRRVIDLPVDLAVFDHAERRTIERFLQKAKRLRAHQGYIASNRKAWWSVGLHKPAPILATYMARRPPAFVRNTAGARHLNIAHGLYPREPIAETVLTNLVEYLSRAVKLTDGRTYAGGLTKFEPREMERLLVPNIELLAFENYVSEYRADLERQEAAFKPTATALEVRRRIADKTANG